MYISIIGEEDLDSQLWDENTSMPFIGMDVILQIYVEARGRKVESEGDSIDYSNLLIDLDQIMRLFFNFNHVNQLDR